MLRRFSRGRWGGVMLQWGRKDYVGEEFLFLGYSHYANNLHTYCLLCDGQLHIVEYSLSKINSHIDLVLTLGDTIFMFTIGYTIAISRIHYGHNLAFTLGSTIASFGILLFTKINSHTYSTFTLGYTIPSTGILLYKKINSHTYLVFTLGLIIDIYGIHW
ncbi:hypothetical protein Cgig2_005081 [Carnegiea gigantea]|uniref:Uncharacterized protein n=1 Tax=Carnegiea gigantea TaxID=171969 RepID=A0A9Q1QUI2_9CARY|nr:hypothetical protein Cgig2_005081 [Carnegiea gigantea]